MKKLILVATVWIASMFWAIVEVAHAATPPEIDILYQNPLIFDASGHLLGAYTAGGAIFSSKGYRLSIYISTGYFLNWPIYFESSDCSGQGYTRWNYDETSGNVFITHDENQEYFLAYTDKNVAPISMTYRSLRRYVNGVHGACEVHEYTQNMAPVLPNNPEITGVINGFGTRDFPYPTPFYYDRESCPGVVPAEINPLYLNTIVKDASGRVLGSGPTGMIFSEKGYHFSIARPTGLLAEKSNIYYQSSDCSGPGFVSVIGNGAGYVFSTTDMNGDFSIRYTQKPEGPVYSVYLSEAFKIANPGPGSSCLNANVGGDFFPVFFNDPAITGVPNNLGSKANPYPVPLSHERFGSN
jgi:hypothetical protein